MVTDADVAGRVAGCRADNLIALQKVPQPGDAVNVEVSTDLTDVESGDTPIRRADFNLPGLAVLLARLSLRLRHWVFGFGLSGPPPKLTLPISQAATDWLSALMETFVPLPVADCCATPASC